MPAHTPALTCRELVEFLADYVAGDLAADGRAVFEAHLVDCAECLAYLRSYRSAVRAARDIGQVHPDDPPADVPDALVRAVLLHRVADLARYR
jgi:anti-sigma factor RsiW